MPSCNRPRLVVVTVTEVRHVTRAEEVRRLVEDAFRSAHLQGFVHARNLDTGSSWGYREDVVCATASVGKIPILVALMQAVGAGEMTLDERIHVGDGPRTGGPTGLSVLPDAVDLSLRAVAQLMIAISDNHATDIILDRVGPDRVTAAMQTLGLPSIQLSGMIRDLYARAQRRYEGADDAAVGELLRTDPDLQPQTAAWRTTPSDMTRLLQLIWAGHAAPPPLCAVMRTMLATCATTNGLVSGFPATLQPRIAHKTGTLTGIRNDAGVIDDGGGHRCAVAVFTLSDVAHWKPQNNEANEALGRAAALAVDYCWER